MFGLQNATVVLQLHTARSLSASIPWFLAVWPRWAREEEAAPTHAVWWWYWLANHCSVVDHGCFKASRAAVRDRTTPLAASAVSRDSHSAGSGGGLPLEPQQDEGKERDRGTENTRRQRQSRAGPRRRSSSQSRTGEHGNVTVAWRLLVLPLFI